MKSNSLVIGSGSIGERHAKNLIKEFNQKVLVLSRFPSKKFRDNFLNESKDISKISYEEVCKYRDFEVVVLATPSSIRSEALKNLENLNIGVIYAEVPAAISSNDLNSLNKKARDMNTFLFPGYNMRFHPGYNEIRSLKTDFLSFRGIFAEYLPSLHLWENYKDRYEAKLDLGGGPLLTSHHELDIAISLLGKVDSVSCLMKNTFLDIEASDHALINLFHKNGKVSNLDLNFFYREYTRRIEISTSNELIIYEPFSNGLKIGNKKISYKDFDFNLTYIESMKNALKKEINSEGMSSEDLNHLLKVTDACFLSSASNGIMTKVK